MQNICHKSAAAKLHVLDLCARWQLIFHDVHPPSGRPTLWASNKVSHGRPRPLWLCRWLNTAKASLGSGSFRSLLHRNPQGEAHLLKSMAIARASVPLVVVSSVVVGMLLAMAVSMAVAVAAVVVVAAVVALMMLPMLPRS